MPHSPEKAIDVLGICGSLRRASFNRMALGVAQSTMPPNMTLDVLDWRSVPPFDADALPAGFPPEVERVRERIRRADAVLIGTPEYNFSLPGMFKNLLDWVSRGEDQPLADKPVAILSAATGPLGGARVQYDLRRVLLFVNASVLVKPEVFIGAAHTKFTPSGECTDAPTRQFVGAHMVAFRRWILEHSRAEPNSPIS